jgi:hypothetical protein
MKTRDLVLLVAAGGLAAWFISNRLKAAGQAVLSAPGAIGEAAGGALFDWIHPDAAGDSVYYTIAFPDGNKHSLAQSMLGPNGEFVYAGINYVMKDDASGFHHAIASGS